MFKKITAAAILVSSVASLTFATPAAAISDGEAAAIGLGAFAVGAMATGAMGGGYQTHHVVYHHCYSRRIYDHWGHYVGRERICD